MKLFVANLTKQNFEFHYWLSENKRPIVQRIPPGGQIEIGANRMLTSDVIERIIEQHAQYGLKSVNEIDNAKTFVGTCYSIDKPVKLDKILNAFDANDDELLKAAHERRKESALASNAIASEIAQQTNSQVDSMEIKVRQEKSDPFSNAQVLDQTIAIDVDEKRGRGRPRRS